MSGLPANPTARTENLTAGEGRCKVWLKKENVGDDLLLILGGGERPHLGGVVLKVPGQPTQTLTHGPHKDLEVLEPIAEAAAEKYGRTVMAVGGVHVDEATSEEVELLAANCRALAGQL